MTRATIYAGCESAARTSVTIFLVPFIVSKTKILSSLFDYCLYVLDGFCEEFHSTKIDSCSTSQRHIFCGTILQHQHSRQFYHPSQFHSLYSFYFRLHETMVLTQSKFLLLVAAALSTSVGAFSPSSYSPSSVSLYRHRSDCSLTC
jgi:hypothetical protein